ncbi:hypothetical protein HAX54_051211, partial [Datura stramonium]|nr:hypothetical protein [Datura stramonium]
MSEYVNVDVDTNSYFELKDYIKELGYDTGCTFSIQPPNSGIIGDIDNDRAHLKIVKCLENGENVSCGKAGPDMEFDETETGKKSIEGRLGGDEPYYLSHDACSFEINEDECWLEDGKRGNIKLSRRRSSSSKS